MKAGIVGLPNVGKSTLFNCLTNGKAQSANFPFCTIEPNFGSVSIPDARLNHLVQLINPEKVVPNTVDIVDIAGLVKGASKGEGLGNQFLANIRETSAIAHVVRCFDDTDVVHVNGEVDPLADISIINTELILADLAMVEKGITTQQKKIKTNDKQEVARLEVLVRIQEALSSGVPVRSVSLSEEACELVSSYHFLTKKPVIYVVNVAENDLVSVQKIIKICNFQTFQAMKCFILE